MKSAAYASYRAAMPPECFGEPDEPDPLTPREIADAPPVMLAVMWWGEAKWDEEVSYYDPDTDTHKTVIAPMTQPVPVGRQFLPECYRAACRFLDLMKRRHGHAWMDETY